MEKEEVGGWDGEGAHAQNSHTLYHTKALVLFCYFPLFFGKRC